MRQSYEQQPWGIVLAAGEGARARDFLKQLCGGRGIKQFCTIIGRYSMLEQTLIRVERLIPRERILKDTTAVCILYFWGRRRIWTVQTEE